MDNTAWACVTTISQISDDTYHFKMNTIIFPSSADLTLDCLDELSIWSLVCMKSLVSTDDVLGLDVSHEHCLPLQLDVDPVLLPDDLLQLLPLLSLQLLRDPEMLQLRLSRPLAQG